MQFSELIKDVKSIIFETKRADNNDYFEAVILNQEIEKLTIILDRFFSLPVWPSKTGLTLQIQEAIKGFGGISQGQTLYFWGEEGQTIFVMLWPWSDGAHITVKIVKK